MRRRLAGAALLVLAATAAAQEEGDENELGWSHSAELSFVSTTGNAETDTFGFQHTSERLFETGRLEVEAAGVRVEADDARRVAVGTSPEDFAIVDASRPEVTAENYLVRGRWERRVSKRLFWFAGAGWERNVFAGFENRSSAGGGVGHTWFDTQRSHLRTDYAVTFTRQDDVVEDPRRSGDFLGLRLSADYGRRLTETTAWEARLIFDENLDDADDFRADFTQSVSVAINERLALKVSSQVLFDNQPSFEELELELPSGEPTGETVLAEVEDIDTVIRLALVVNF